MAAKIEGQDPSTVRMNDFKTPELDTAAQDAWIKRIRGSVHQGTGTKSYDVTRQNCATFCISGFYSGERHPK